jgi:hypothetical protein
MNEYLNKLSVFTLFLIGAVLANAETNQTDSDDSINSENKFTIPTESFEIINEVAELILDASIVGCKLNNNLLGLKTSDYLAVKFGVPQDEIARTAIFNNLLKHIKNIDENNTDYARIVLNNSNVQIITKRYEEILKKLSVDLIINVDDYDNVQHALLYSLFWEMEVKKMLKWKEFKNFDIDYHTVMSKLASKLRSEAQVFFNTENCQSMLKKFASNDWRTYINSHRNIEGIVEISSQSYTQLIMRKALISGEFKTPIVVTEEYKNKITKALEISRSEFEKINVFTSEILLKLKEKLTEKYGEVKGNELVNRLKDEKDNFLYASLRISFTDETINSMIVLNNKKPLSSIVKDKDQILGTETFNVISKLVEGLK